MGNSESVRPDNIAASGVSTNIRPWIPEIEYTSRLVERQQRLAGIRILHRRLWTYLIVATLGVIVITCVTLSSPSFSKLWILPPAVLALSVLQSLTKNARAHSRVQRIVSFYELGIARLHDQWQGRGIGGDKFRPDDHPYATDLDVFGAGSLFELLCTARTGVGQAMLAHWLLKPGGHAEATQRQAAVAELRDMLDLREDWVSLGRDAVDQVDSSAVRSWVGAPNIAFPFYVRALAIALPIGLIALSIVPHVAVFGHSWLWTIAILIGLEALLAAFLMKNIRFATANLVLPSFELALLAPLLDRIEAGQFECSLLKSLQSQLTASSGRPSKQIRILSLWVWLLDLRRSEHFALPASLVLWGTNLAILIERWRQQNREALARWLDSLGQFEALLCLARHSYENPDHTFPVLKLQASPLFHAEALGHPLLDRKTCVKCDLRLDSQGTQLAIVSGSNMSGKSTLLRSVGVNSVLAFAGAPVRADRLQISTFQIGCSIAVHDSLLQAKSRFQAEVERLKLILALSHTNSLLFLLDEVLGGTNSNDRLWGAKAVLERLTGNGAVGLVTTHDLALTGMAKNFDRAINVHFEEHYENGEMRFDYRMRAGVVTSTNGVNVMAALGLLPLAKIGETDLTTPNLASTEEP